MLQSCVSLPINRNYNAFNRKHNVVTDTGVDRVKCGPCEISTLTNMNYESG